MNTDLKIHEPMFDLLRNNEFTGLPLRMQLYSGDKPVGEPLWLFGQQDDGVVGFHNQGNEHRWNITETARISHLLLFRACDNTLLITWDISNPQNAVAGDEITIKLPTINYHTEAC